MVDVTEDPTLPADDTTTEESAIDVTDDYIPGEDSAYSPDEVDLDDIEPDTYLDDLVGGDAAELFANSGYDSDIGSLDG